ncbi:MAG TPA: hypothetical protein VKZ97_10400 [Flavobacteriaceae bacterium]|nr:hypothetical protein [Flavobacteriaceae bacterium]
MDSLILLLLDTVVGRSSNTCKRNTDLARAYYKTMDDAIIEQTMCYSVWDEREWFVFANGLSTFLLTIFFFVVTIKREPEGSLQFSKLGAL